MIIENFNYELKELFIYDINGKHVYQEAFDNNDKLVIDLKFEYFL